MDTTAPAVQTRRWETFAPLTGIATVLLFVAGFIVHDVIGDTPAGDAPAADFSRYYENEDGTIWAGGILISLGLAFFLWFVGTVRAALHAAEGGVGRLAATAYAGGIATAVLMLASIGTQVSAALLVEEREAIAPETGVAYWFVGDGLFLAAFYTAAVLLAASGVVILRTAVLPRWFAWITLALALLLLIPWIGWAGFIFAFPLWIIVMSVMLWQAGSRSQAV